MTEPNQQPAAPVTTANVFNRKLPAANPGVRPAAAPAAAPAGQVRRPLPARSEEAHAHVSVSPKSTFRQASVAQDTADLLPQYKPAPNRFDTLSLVSFDNFGGSKQSVYVPGVKSVQYDPNNPADQYLLNFDEAQERWGFIAVLYSTIDANGVPVPGIESYKLQAIIVYKNQYEELRDMFSVLNRQTGERAESLVDFVVTATGGKNAKKFVDVIDRTQDSAVWLTWKCRDQIIQEASDLMSHLDLQLGVPLSPQMVAQRHANWQRKEEQFGRGGQTRGGGQQAPRAPQRAFGGQPAAYAPPADSPAMGQGEAPDGAPTDEVPF